jgi:putative endonuclease
MSISTRERGTSGEDLAAAYLEQQGLKIIARNLSCKVGELDLVCLDHEILIIVEVRLRAHPDFGGALASVTRTKQLKVIRAAQYQWQRTPEWRTRRMRFDVIAIQGSDMLWIKDAFRQ